MSCGVRGAPPRGDRGPADAAPRGCRPHAPAPGRGVTEGVTLLLLALQTGLLDLQILQRTFLLSIILFIVVTSTLQSMIEIADPIVLALGASRNRYRGEEERQDPAPRERPCPGGGCLLGGRWGGAAGSPPPCAGEEPGWVPCPPSAPSASGPRCPFFGRTSGSGGGWNTASRGGGCRSRGGHGPAELCLP